MNDAPRRTLRELIDRHGPGLCSDARRCEGLLRDLCGEHRREINILAAALRERVPLDLLAGRSNAPTGLLLARLSKRLEDHLAVTEEAARWAVDSWALALGVVSDAGLKELEGRRAQNAPTRVEAAQTTTASRPPSKDEPRASQTPPGPNVRPPATAQRAPQSPPPPPAQPPPFANPPVPRSPASRATPPAAQGGSAPATRQPKTTPAARPPSSPKGTQAGGLQEPSTGITPRRGRGRWRGCLVGCLMILLLSGLLALGVPYVLNVLREEQQQRNLDPPPGQPR